MITSSSSSRIDNKAEHQAEDGDLRDNLPGSVPLARLGGSENGEPVSETVEVYKEPRDVDTDQPEIYQVERKDEEEEDHQDDENNQDEENDQEEQTNIQDTSPDHKQLQGQTLVRERCHHLARSFRERTQRARNKFELPPTPSTISSDPGNEEVNNIHVSPFKKEENVAESRDWEKCARSEISSCFMVEQQGCIYITWLSVVTLSYLYNCFVIPLRTTFPYQTDSNTPTWMILDYSMDVIYFLDLIIIKPRIVYLEDGFWVRDIKRTRRNYLKKAEFKMDVMSLIPLDLLYFYIGYPYPILRITRMLKIHSFREFFNHFDKVLPSPYIVRVARTLTYMVYLVHINACAYFAVSCFEGLGSNKWVYNGKGNAYVRCIYFAVKTATSIGKNPRPENRAEYLFMTACWLMGVFVFAILIGQIRDIIATATRAQTDYRKRVDETLDYLRKLNLPPPLIERVKMWFTYTWQQQHTLDESRLLDHLPNKLKTDVAINVHISTINKVQLFKDCDEALLRELVLKLRPVLYLPGDYICRKGEVGKEMYIVKSGQVQVVSQDGTEVLATLTEGSVFGEISLLSISGCNRRTADVRSNGFSSLFVLNKDDLNEALVFHPNAQEILKRKAKQLMKQNADRERQQHKAEVLIANPETPKLPKLLPIVLKVLPPESGPARLLKYGSRYRRGGKAPNSARPTSSSQEVKEMTRWHSLDLGQLSQKERETNFIFPPRCSVLVHNEDRYG